MGIEKMDFNNDKQQKELKGIKEKASKMKKSNMAFKDYYELTLALCKMHGVEIPE